MDSSEQRRPAVGSSVFEVPTQHTPVESTSSFLERERRRESEFRSAE